MSPKRLRAYRRIAQGLTLAVFVWLVLQTTFGVDIRPDPSGVISLPYPVSFFLELDPLAALTTLLSSWTLYKGMAWALVILIPTIFLGRFFCGWLCPMGTLNHMVSQIPAKRGRRAGARKAETNRYRPYQRIKYLVLFVVLGAAAMGSLLAGLLDPISLLARSLGTVVLPTLHTVAADSVTWVKGIGWPPLGRAAQGMYEVVGAVLLPYQRAQFHGILLLALVFITVLVLNRVFSRFWCRGICPLGALLGLFSRFSILGLVKDESTCTRCNRCLTACQGGDDPIPGATWRKAECHLCFNCTAECPEGSVRFSFLPDPGPASAPVATPAVDVGRRATLIAAGAGLVSVPLMRTGDSFDANPDPARIRPPGALPEDEFLARCIRCGQCMRVCPNNALHPAALQAGFEGLWTPVLISRVGYCEPTCTLCGEVCPTGALASLSILQKVGGPETPPTRIGTAFVDRGRCLPWAMDRPCIVCEEWCPTSPKAVLLTETTVTDRDGKEVVVKRPRVDPALCTGCGACEFACPVNDRRAIRVTSVGESRSWENQILPGRIPDKRDME